MVGSSGRLHQRGHGAEVDSHSLVIRVNQAPTARHEADVGTVTHIRFSFCGALWTAIDVEHVVGWDEILTIRDAEDFRCDKWWLQPWLERGQVVFVEPEWQEWLHRQVDPGVGSMVSAGFASVAVAIALAQLVGARPPTVYGFGSCPSCAKYYECNHVDKDGVLGEAFGLSANHAFGTEHDILHDTWHEMGAINFVEEPCE